MSNPLLEWAIYYQRNGFSVIPISPSEKKPLVLWKMFQFKPFPDEAQITEWWTKWPNADIGIITGMEANRLILDIDKDDTKDGFKSIEGKELPHTPIIRSKKGLHYHFKWDNRLNETKTTIAGLLPGVDLRGNGGYAKMPPSSCSDNSQYSFVSGSALHEVPLAEPPQWLLDLLIKPVSNEKPLEVVQEHWLEEILDGVGLGERHGALVRLAGYYFNCMAQDVAIQHLKDWNKKNKPPFIEDELLLQVNDLKERFKKGEYKSNFLQDQKDFSLISATEVVDRYSSKIDYLVEGLIPIGTSVIFAGWQGLGKTFVATDLVTEIARKKGMGAWLGTFRTKHGPVIYIDNEMGGNLTSYRLRQLLLPKGLATEDLDLHYSIRNRVKFTNEKHYNKLRNDIARIRPMLVVMDSFASCHSLDENVSKDMRHFFDDLIAPICDEFKCTIMLVDHEGKGVAGIHQYGSKRLRGSGAKGDAVDQIISLDWQDNTLLFEHSKARYQKRHDTFAIEIQDINNGTGIKVVNAGYLEQKK